MLHIHSDDMLDMPKAYACFYQTPHNIRHILCLTLAPKVRMVYYDLGYDTDLRLLVGLNKNQLNVGLKFLILWLILVSFSLLNKKIVGCLCAKISAPNGRPHLHEFELLIAVRHRAMETDLRRPAQPSDSRRSTRRDGKLP